MKDKNKIYIQAYLDDGNWRTVSTTIDTSLSVLNHMKQAAKIHIGKRIRAIDDNGQVVEQL